MENSKTSYVTLKHWFVAVKMTGQLNSKTSYVTLKPMQAIISGKRVDSKTSYVTLKPEVWALIAAGIAYSKTSYVTLKPAKIRHLYYILYSIMPVKSSISHFFTRRPIHFSNPVKKSSNL